LLGCTMQRNVEFLRLHTRALHIVGANSVVRG
jgi:hypothetical protein